MNEESIQQKQEHGYDAETAQKYTAGQEQFFTIDNVDDGATRAMEESIIKIIESYKVDILCDIGCGSNKAYLERWKTVSGATTVIGIEPSPHMRALLLKEQQEGKTLIVADGDWLNTGLTSNSVGMVTSRFSFHHVQNTKEGYAELSRILKSGGYAVISLPHPEYCAKELEKKNLPRTEGAPMSVEVFNTTLHYFYHDIDAYLGEGLVGSGLSLVESKSFNWGTKNASEMDVPNTLLFVLKKMD